MRKRYELNLYTKHESLNDSVCYYCGQLGYAKDYIPPAYYDIPHPMIYKYIIRSCLLCNSFLRNKDFPTLLKRSEYLLFRYQKRFKSVLALPAWDEEELEDLDKKLRMMIVKSLKQKAFIEAKLLYLEENISILTDQQN